MRGRTRERLIPAHAGKTQASTPKPLSSAAHPRSRGENINARVAACCASGSSPLTRGKPTRRSPDGRSRRLIPAHAGKTPLNDGMPRYIWAHPRSRGENQMHVDPTKFDDGSSPLTRGKLVDAVEGRVLKGLIPAHAGKTRAPTRLSLRRGAHPRSRGENSLTASPLVSFRGSSPLTRGKHCPSTPQWWMTRLIPAHAGKTLD